MMVRLRPKPRFGNVQMDGLLDALSVPRVGDFRRRRGKGYLRANENRGGFWVRNADKLDGMLFDIHGAYQSAILRAHPDKGGTHGAAVKVNLAWAKVKRLFGKHGILLN